MYKILWKVVEKVKKLKLNFIGTGLKDKYQALVYIYDAYGNLVYKKKTYDGVLTLHLRKNHVYKLVATSCGDTIYSSFYTNKSKYCFVFNRSILRVNNARTITFLLTDFYYKNLPIEKGEMYLWQRQ